MTDSFDAAAFRTAPERTALAAIAPADVVVVRSCRFSFAGKILTPVDDLLVPLVAEHAVDDLLSRSGVSAVVTTPALAQHIPSTMGLALADDPMRAHHAIHLALSQIPGRLWRDYPTHVAPSARVHPSAWIAPLNVRIDADAVIMPFAAVHERTIVGAGTRVHSHATLGADAYEIVMIDGCQVLRPQTGGVVIGRQCEIMAGSIVTRSAFCGATMIEDHCVLDGNVTVSHDCTIGANVRIGGGSWLGGRVAVGERAALGPNCTIANGLRVGPAAKISLGAVVTRDVADGAHVSGNFAIDHARLVEQLRRIR